MRSYLASVQPARGENLHIASLRRQALLSNARIKPAKKSMPYLQADDDVIGARMRSNRDNWGRGTKLEWPRTATA